MEVEGENEIAELFRPKVFSLICQKPWLSSHSLQSNTVSNASTMREK